MTPITSLRFPLDHNLRRKLSWKAETNISDVKPDVMADIDKYIDEAIAKFSLDAIYEAIDAPIVRPGKKNIQMTGGIGVGHYRDKLGKKGVPVDKLNDLQIMSLANWGSRQNHRTHSSEYS